MWEFKGRFRRHAFGWKSQPALQRVKQAVSEVKKVARADPALAAEGAVAFIERRALGGTIGEFARQRPELLERARATMLEGLAKAEGSRPPKPAEHWALADRFAGIEHAQLAVFNVRRDREREAAERLIAELGRVRKDEDLFNDILGLRDSRIPITAVVANFADPDDPGRKKALARSGRVLVARSG